jgi:hypothetical protein
MRLKVIRLIELNGAILKMNDLDCQGHQTETFHSSRQISFMMMCGDVTSYTLTIDNRAAHLLALEFF